MSEVGGGKEKLCTAVELSNTTKVFKYFFPNAPTAAARGIACSLSADRIGPSLELAACSYGVKIIIIIIGFLKRKDSNKQTKECNAKDIWDQERANIFASLNNQYLLRLNSFIISQNGNNLTNKNTRINGEKKLESAFELKFFASLNNQYLLRLGVFIIFQISCIMKKNRQECVPHTHT